jgi:hypothetical protein
MNSRCSCPRLDINIFQFRLFVVYSPLSFLLPVKMTDFNQPVNSAQNLSRRVWFKLIDSSTGKIYPTTTVTSLHIESTADIDTFRKRMHSETSTLLRDILPMQLQVYENEASLKNNQEPLSPGTQIGFFGISDKSPLILVVPVGRNTLGSRESSTTTLYLYLAEEAGVDAEAVQMYSDMADRMRNHEETKTYIDILYDGFIRGKMLKVFNALCVPSGTGKTQLAFALPKEKCTCIYLNMACDAETIWKRQPVYRAFMGYMNLFISWVKEDYSMANPTSLRIYGFLKALITLIKRHPDLELPRDFSRVQISHLPRAGSEILGFADKDTITLELKNWIQMYGKELVIFIDEFAATNIVKQEELAFLRRRLMDVGACVIVASTDSGAMNMFNTQAATMDSREALDPWVQLSTQLPKYVPPTRLRTLLDRCNNPAVKMLIELCLQSRPLFAAAVCEKIEELLSSNTSMNMIDFFDDLRDKLVDVLRSKVTAGLPEGCFGYVTAMLLAGGALISADEANNRLFGNLTTKNWAYLVHDPIVISDGAPTVDAAKRARLQTSNGTSELQDRFMRMSIRQREPTFLLLWRKSGFISGKDVLQFQHANIEHHFSCTSFFPDPSEDFLFYLVLAGSRKSPGLEVFDDVGRRRRVSVATLLNTVFTSNKKLPFSVNDIVPSFAYHEALVCAAFYTACNSGSLSGCSLEELLTRFVAELMVPFSYPKLTKVDNIPLVGQEFSARFVFPFDTSLPNEVHQILHTAQASRPPTGECVDVASFIPNGSATKSYQVIVEAKSTTKPEYVKERIKLALNRQDFNAKVSFIVVDKNPDKDMLFNPEDFQVLNRTIKVGRRFKKGARLSARIFRVDVDDTLKVVLTPIDGQSKDTVADRVIFVICLASINGR